MPRAVFRRFAALAAAAAGFAAAAGPGAGAEPITPLNLLAGQPEGVYYEVAGRLQRRVNANLADHGLMLSTATTAGSAENGRRLLAARGDLAIMQADVVERIVAEHLAAGGTGLPPLQVLAMLLEERLLIVARGPAAERGTAGLVGARLGLDLPGSGARESALAALGALGLAPGAWRETSAGVSARADLLCAGRLDAAAFVLAVPNPVLTRLTERCGARVLPLGGEGVERLATGSALWTLAPLPASAGPGATGTVTLALRAALVQAALGEAEGLTLLEAAFDPAGTAALGRVASDGRTLADAARIAPLPAAPAAAAFFAERGLGLDGGPLAPER